MININTKTLHEIDQIESRIEDLKWSLRLPAQSKTSSSSSIKATSGILSKKFPSGITYENRARKAWQKRFKAGS